MKSALNCSGYTADMYVSTKMYKSLTANAFNAFIPLAMYPYGSVDTSVLFNKLSRVLRAYATLRCRTQQSIFFLLQKLSKYSSMQNRQNN
jgi:hypothetical protein